MVLTVVFFRLPLHGVTGIPGALAVEGFLLLRYFEYVVHLIWKEFVHVRISFPEPDIQKRCFTLRRGFKLFRGNLGLPERHWWYTRDIISRTERQATRHNFNLQLLSQQSRLRRLAGWRIVKSKPVIISVLEWFCDG